MQQMLSGTFHVAPSWWLKSKSGTKRVLRISQILTSTVFNCSQLSPKAELASNPKKERTMGWKVVSGFVKTFIWSPPYEKEEGVLPSFSLKMPSQKEKCRIISRNWSASKKGKMASYSSVGCWARGDTGRNMSAKWGQSQKRGQKEAAWTVTITYGKDTWVSTG